MKFESRHTKTQDTGYCGKHTNTIKIDSILEPRKEISFMILNFVALKMNKWNKSQLFYRKLKYWYTIYFSSCVIQ